MWTVYVPETGDIMTQDTLLNYFQIESNKDRKERAGHDPNIRLIMEYRCWVMESELPVTKRQCMDMDRTVITYAINLSNGATIGIPTSLFNEIAQTLPQVFGNLSV